MEPKPESVLFVLEHFPPYLGGVERLFFQLARQLVERGLGVTVVTTQHQKKLPVYEEMDGIQVYRVRSANRYLFTLMGIPSVVRHARRCTIIHTTTYNAALPAWVAGLLTGKKVLITVHEIWGRLWFDLPWMGYLSKRLHFLFEQLVLKLPFHHYTAVSDYTRNTLVSAGIPSEKITTLYNGLDYQLLQPWRRSQPPGNHASPRFMYYGRLGFSKGLDLVIRAGDSFLAKHPHTLIDLIIPQKPAGFRRRIERLILAARHPDGFKITDSLPEEELFRHLQKADAVLIPSYSEGFCFVAAEASFLGIPVISSHKGALPETATGKVIRMKNLDALSLYDAMEQAFLGQWEEIPLKTFPLEDQISGFITLYGNFAGH